MSSSSPHPASHAVSPLANSNPDLNAATPAVPLPETPARLKTAVIVPAYNEAGRITSVLRVIAQAKTVDEIIVVTDGCQDSTADEARGFSARLARNEVRDSEGQPVEVTMRVFELVQNIGKGGAMMYGALRTQADVLLFLDADLIGLRPDQVDTLLEPAICPVSSERADMVLGLFGSARGGLLGWWLSVCHRNLAAITGQRAIRRDVFLAVPDLTKSRYGVETAITRYVYHWGLDVKHVQLDDITHPLKEEKVGIWRGFARRMGMYRQIVGSAVLFSIRTNATSQQRAQSLQMRERFSQRS